jgi:2-amino-4-hydroxy-6-hydroxymethyldihydropteridine diphosphokinase
MHAWIGLGSNIGNGMAVIGAAIGRLGATDGLEVLRRSGLYESEPWGFRAQPRFTNAVIELRTRLAPLSLLATLGAIERKMGRRGSRRWGPRIIDLDILLLGERILVLENLVVPHPRMHRRRFVLAPLFEVAPDLVIPGRGTVRSCLERLPGQAVHRLDPEGGGGAATGANGRE